MREVTTHRHTAELMGRWWTLGLICICAMLTGCATEPPPTERAPRPVRVAEAIQAAVDEGRVFSGLVQAPTRSRLSFRVPGRIVRRPVDIGLRLRGGQLVAQLDATDFRLRVERAAATLDRARAEARVVEASFERTQALYVNDNATAGDLDQAVARVEQARGLLTEAQRSLEIAQRELEHTRLLAPTSGLVSEVFAAVGENVQIGQQVVDFVDGDAALEVEWTVPEGLIGQFRPGMEVMVRFPALGGASSPASIVDIGATPRAGQATFPLVARFAETDPRLLPGMAAEVHVRLPSASAVRSGGKPPSGVVLPPHAVAGDPSGWYVFVVEDATEDAAPGTKAGITAGELRQVRRQEVSVGRLRPEGLEILTGLDGGETVVAAGVSFLDDGQTVRLLRGDPLAELPTTAAAAGAQP